jgi:hypothetical protein
MKTISQIYSEYKIMPTLQLHQIRVAAVAKSICNSLVVGIDTETVIKVCLLHDMGNIIKFDLNYFPDFIKPEGLEYWQKVKDEYINKYGNEEHIATKMICEEVGLSDKGLKYLSSIGFSRVKTTFDNGTIEEKICCYADHRVGPHGVLTIEERQSDGRRRYAGRKDKAMTSDKFESLAEAMKQLENQIFSKSNIKPEDIKDDSIENYLDGLKSVEI